MRRHATHQIEEPPVSDPALLLARAAENAEPRRQLAETQEQCIALAVDAGERRAEAEPWRRALIDAQAGRDAWRDSTPAK